MDVSKSIAAVSSPPSERAQESPISALLYDVSQQVRDAMQNMLKMTSEIDRSSGEIVEQIDKCKESAGVKSKVLEEEKDRFKKAAMAVLQMLNGVDVD